MARPSYPSDQNRNRKPAVRIHHSILGHPKTAGLVGDNDLFATLVRLWLLGSIRHAGKTGDVLTLSATDLELVSGRRRRDVALTLLERCAHVMGYSWERRGNVYDITLRNFAKKQGFAPQLRTVLRNDSAASDSDSDSVVSSTTNHPTKIETTKGVEAGTDTVNGNGVVPPPIHADFVEALEKTTYLQPLAESKHGHFWQSLFETYDRADLVFCDEIAKADLWLVAHPEKARRRKAAGLPRYFLSWIQRALDDLDAKKRASTIARPIFRR